MIYIKLSLQMGSLAHNHHRENTSCKSANLHERIGGESLLYIAIVDLDSTTSRLERLEIHLYM